MPFKREYYQETIPETITVKDRTYITLELINQARREYKESRKIINLYNNRSLKTAYHRRVAGQSRYTREDAEFCAGHTVQEIAERFGIEVKRAYTTRNYLCNKFGLSFRTEYQRSRSDPNLES